MNQFSVIASGFEHLSYPLGKNDSSDKQVFSDRDETFVLHRVDNEVQARMLVGSSDWISEHSSSPVGFVADEKGEFFVVCHTLGKIAIANTKTKRLQPDDMADSERIEFSHAVVKRLAAIHTEGFGCGGLKPEAVEYSKKSARLLDPSAIFALDDSDSIFYEAAVTLRSLVGSGFAQAGNLRALAAAYLSFSPICRHGVASYLASKGKKARTDQDLGFALEKKARQLLTYI